MRLQAAGIINTWEFDSIILGSSMLENTSAREASEYLGGSFVNISIYGSDFFERSIVLSYALKRKSIKKVLYSLDYFGLIDSRRNINLYNKELFLNLYDDNIYNDFPIYFNDKYIKCIFSITEQQNCMGDKLDFDRPNSWYKNPKIKARFGGFERWLKDTNNRQMKRDFRIITDSVNEIKKNNIALDEFKYKKIEESRRYLDETILAFVRKNPDTKFIMVVPLTCPQNSSQVQS